MLSPSGSLALMLLHQPNQAYLAYRAALTTQYHMPDREYRAHRAACTKHHNNKPDEYPDQEYRACQAA